MINLVDVGLRMRGFYCAGHADGIVLYIINSRKSRKYFVKKLPFADTILDRAMYEAILIITGLVTIFLAVRLIMKFREMSSWKDEDVVVGGNGNSALPTELRELKIDEPPEDAINRLDASEDKNIPGDNIPPKQT